MGDWAEHFPPSLAAEWDLWAEQVLHNHQSQLRQYSKKTIESVYKNLYTSGVHLCFVQELNRIGVDDKEVRGFFNLS